MIVIIDPGHTENENRGALVGDEGSNTFHMSQALKQEFEKYQNVTVILTRKQIGDNPGLIARGKTAKRGTDLFLSVHSNAFSDPSVRGIEIWKSVKTVEEKLANDLCEGLAAYFGGVNRGVKVRKNSNGLDWYGVLRNSSADVSYLIEYGFHTNPEDAKNLVEKREEIARKTVEVIAQRYKLRGKETVTVSPAPMPAEPLRPKASLKVDGYFGPETIKALQRYLGTPVDGKISRPSMMVKELQRKLNEGRL